jgi:Mg2+ and Co2+ transporter CorA
MNVPYPGFSDKGGFAAAIAIMIVAGVILYVVFRKRDWL